jgi:hypothetical protein
MVYSMRICLTARSEIAAAVEGRDTITVLHLGEDWALAEQQQLGLPGLTQPAALQVSRHVLCQVAYEDPVHLHATATYDLRRCSFS